MSEGKLIYSSEKANHSMMDFVGTSLLPQDFSNFDLYDIKNSKYFFSSEKTYLMGERVIYYVPKEGKEYAEPSQIGWYIAKNDITGSEIGPFNPEQWIQLSIFNIPYKQDLVNNLNYVNRLHTTHNSINTLVNMRNMIVTDDSITRVDNINPSNDILVSDFNELPTTLTGLELPIYNNKWSVPIIDISLIDINNNALAEYSDTVHIAVGYDKLSDGSYSSTKTYIVDKANLDLSYVDTTTLTPAGDGKFYLLGINPSRLNELAIKYAVFGIYTLVR